jgi:translation initiation factor IF-1
LTLRPTFCYAEITDFNLMEKEKKSVPAVYGVVTEALPNTLFKVRHEGEDKEVLAYLSGRMRLNRIRVLIGDKVQLELDPYGGRARIIKRL